MHFSNSLLNIGRRETGLLIEQFNIIMECLHSFVHLLSSYVEKQVSEKTFDLKTQLLAVLTI